MPPKSPKSLSASIALGLSATHYAPIAPLVRSARGQKAVPETPFRRALVVTGARRQSVSIGHELARGLRERGIPTDVHVAGGRQVPRASAPARLAVARPDLDLVLSVGGVRRLAELLGALPRPDIRAACLPLFRDRASERLARLFPWPRDVDGLLELVLEDRATRVQMLSVSGELALFRAAFGFEALWGRRATPPRAQRSACTWRRDLRGRLTDMLDACRHTFAVEIDGRRLPGAYVNVAARPAAGDSVPRSTGPARLSVELWPARGALLGLARAGLGLPHRELAARRVRILADAPVPGHVDGRVLSTRAGRALSDSASGTEHVIELAREAHPLLFSAR